jgi:hypothetical protein
VIEIDNDPRKTRRVVSNGTFPGPDLRPHSSGTLEFKLPKQSVVGVLQIDVVAPNGSVICTRSWDLGVRYFSQPPQPEPAEPSRHPDIKERGDAEVVSGFGTDLEFVKSNGFIRSIRRNGQSISISGPRVVAFVRKDRSFNAIDREVGAPTLTATSSSVETSVQVAFSTSPLHVRWTIRKTGDVNCSWEEELDTDADIVGIAFDYPEANVKSKRWLGRGPYRVYRNRMEGGVLDVHELAYNDPIPGQTCAYPEFKGSFRDWQWITLTTTEGDITIENASGVPFLGLYASRDGDPPMLTFPDTGIAFLDVIPAMGSKFATPDTTGPQGQTPHVSGVKRGSIVFRFDPH